MIKFHGFSTDCTCILCENNCRADVVDPPHKFGRNPLYKLTSHCFAFSLPLCVCVCVCSTAHKTKLKIRRHTEHHTRFHTDAGDSTQKPNQFGVVSINRILQAHLSIHHPPDPPHTHTPSLTATIPFPKVSTITAENYFVFYFAVNTQN